MKLSQAFQMTVTYLGREQEIRVNEQGLINLNDMALFYPHKSIQEWLSNKSTKEFIVVIERFLKQGNSTELKVENFSKRGAVPKGLESIKTKRGKYGGGTYAHELVALEFATWLSPEFKLNVLLAYQNGTQRKADWNIKRILASENYKLQCESIKESPEGQLPKGMGYVNNGKLINIIVFGKHEKARRDSATEQELEEISYLESKNSAYIDLGIDYETRKKILTDLHTKKYKTVKCIEVCND